MTAQEEHEVSGELVPFQQSRTLDLRDAATDSWTDVIEEVGTLAGRIADTAFVPDTLRGNGAAVAAAILSGREVGMAPMTALATINVIKGKPAVSAEAMRGLVLQAGHSIVVTESTSSRVIMKGRRRGDEEWTSVTWTMDDAKRAGLRGDNWSKYPRQMLTARCTTELCRLVFADVIHGLRSVEEMADAVDSVTEVQQVPAEPQRTTTVQRKRAAKKAAAKPADESDKPGDVITPDVTPPARKRVDLPPPKTSSPTDGVSGEDKSGPEGEGPPDTSGPPTPEEPPAGDNPQQQGKDDSGNDAEIVDAEIVTGRSSGPKISHGQRGAIIGHFKRLGVDDRDEYLLITNVLLGLEPGTIDSTNNLRGDEPQRLLKILEVLRDRDALDQRLNGQDQLVGGDE